MVCIQLFLMSAAVMSLATCGQIPESKLDKLYKHLHSRKEAKREGQDKVVGGDDIDNDKGAAKPIKKLIIVSSKDNKTIIETIQTEEEKRNYIERSRIKRKRIKLEPSRKVMVKGNGDLLGNDRKNKMKIGSKEIKKRRKDKKVEENLTPEEWLDRFYKKGSLKSISKKKSKKKTSSEVKTDIKNKSRKKDEVKKDYSELVLKPLTIFSRGDNLLEEVNTKNGLKDPMFRNQDKSNHPMESKKYDLAFQGNIDQNTNHVVWNGSNVSETLSKKLNVVNEISS